MGIRHSGTSTSRFRQLALYSHARRHAAVSLLSALLVVAPLCGTTHAQTTASTAPQGDSSSGFVTCDWYLYKFYDQLWGWLGIQLLGSRSFGTDYEQSSYIELHASVTIWTEFLPTETLSCQITDVGTSAGTVSNPYGTVEYINHTNSSCNNHPTLVYGYDPSRSYTVSSQLWNANSTAASGAEGARGTIGVT